uniref:DUF2971 domain-containing protein n=1 Tax=Castellaniella defragrans TaxID=75697 RepID=UPI0033423941
MPPKTLYKYRSFSSRTVEQLCHDQLFFADPSTFNDPLDTQPCVVADCDVERLKRTVCKMVRQRTVDTMSAAANTIRYRGQKTADHIEKLSIARAEQAIEQDAYNARDPSHELPYENAYRRLLIARLKRELLLQYEKGVVSLAQRYNCPLMWSHYGDQHRGICIGYTVPPDALPNLQAVSYGGHRTVSADAVAAMILDKDEAARSKVDAAVLFRKAKDWKYEKEWRLLGPRGLNESSLDLCEIVFGMRCSDSVKYAVIRSLEKRDGTAAAFYEIRAVADTFRLKRYRVDVDELCRSYPHRARSVLEDFEAFDSLDHNQVEKTNSLQQSA